MLPVAVAPLFSYKNKSDEPMIFKDRKLGENWDLTVLPSVN